MPEQLSGATGLRGNRIRRALFSIPVPPAHRAEPRCKRIQICGCFRLWDLVVPGKLLEINRLVKFFQFSGLGEDPQGCFSGGRRRPGGIGPAGLPHVLTITARPARGSALMNCRMLRLASGLLCAVSVLAAANYAGAAETPDEVPAVGRLPDICEVAKAQFRPLTEADLQARRGDLVDAVARLDRRLEAAGENGAAWDRYLQMNRLRAQLENGKVPDQTVLDKVYKRCTAGHEGLELVWFLDLRDALRRYRETARNVGDPELQTRYGKLLDFLAGRLRAYAAEPTENDALLIGRVLAERGVDLLHVRGDGRIQTEKEVAREARFRKTQGQGTLFDLEESEPWRSTRPVLPIRPRSRSSQTSSGPESGG